jgi:hypothetical protein
MRMLFGACLPLPMLLAWSVACCRAPQPETDRAKTPDRTGAVGEGEGVAPEPPAPQPSPGPLQVCGTLDDVSPNYAFDSAKLEDFPQDPRDMPRHLPGPFTMALEDGSGRELTRIEFGAMWGHAARLGLDGGVDCHPVKVGFSCLNVPFVRGARSLIVRRGDLVLARYNRTPSAPELRITSPSPGASLPAEGQKLLVSWEASDEDGDLLTHSIYYRPDAGADGQGLWKAVIGDFREQSMELDPILLPPGPRPELMVLTTDRFNTTRAVVALKGAPGADDDNPATERNDP